MRDRASWRRVGWRRRGQRGGVGWGWEVSVGDRRFARPETSTVSLFSLCSRSVGHGGKGAWNAIIFHCVGNSSAAFSAESAELASLCALWVRARHASD